MKHVVVCAMLILLHGFGHTGQTEWIGKKAPDFADGIWINSRPLELSDLRGKVLLLEFWTFGCYNCLNTLPFLKAWHRKFTAAEFVIVGVHTPEFDGEKNPENVRTQITRLGIEYPVVTDNDYRTWTSYHQRYWPAMYLIDKKGIIRYVHVGEGAYDETEKQIIRLLAE